MDKLLHPLESVGQNYLSNPKLQQFEVWEWISNFIPNSTGYVITYPCWDLKLNHLVKGAPGGVSRLLTSWYWYPGVNTPGYQHQKHWLNIICFRVASYKWLWLFITWIYIGWWLFLQKYTLKHCSQICPQSQYQHSNWLSTWSWGLFIRSAQAISQQTEWRLMRVYQIHSIKIPQL